MTLLALCQINPWVGHLSYNLGKIKDYLKRCQEQQVDLVIFPECAISGYPLEDLVLKPHFLEKVESIIYDLVQATHHSSTAVLIGAPWVQSGQIVNAALFIAKGEIQSVIAKHILPNYGVFDEKRIFQPGPLSTPLLFQGIQLGIMICEDMWFAEPARHLQQQGAEVLVVLNGSPFDLTKQSRRHEHAKLRVQQTSLPLIYVNLVGGQDHLVFDGRSFVMASDQTLVTVLPAFTESLALVKVRKEHDKVLIQATNPQPFLPEDKIGLLYNALVMGLKDYVTKNGFDGVLLGLSGGVDSALVAAIAVDALGADRVSCVMMPSPYTSDESLQDAQAIRDFLETSYDSLSIVPAITAYTTILQDKFIGKPVDITEENIQSRARGMILMALSNKTGWMVLSTGNKSEMAVGYATLYGDMCGGYNPLKDVYKTQVFALAQWRNTHYYENFLGPKGQVMPERVISKPPSAELKPNQKDQDSLPDYTTLDAILQDLIEEDLSIEEIVKKGYTMPEVSKIYRLLERAEYKRRQSPPGPKITVRSLTAERRYPITNGFLLNL